MAKGGLDNFDEDTCSSVLTKLTPKYVTDRVYLSYTPPPFPDSDGIFSQAEVEEWLSRINEIQEDLIWLLELPYNKFWSHFAFDEKVPALLTSYVQNTPRPYDLEEFIEAMERVNSSKILEAQDKVHALVLAIYVRLVEFEDSKETTFLLTSSEFGDLIYDKFIFDIPTVYDICLVYGGSNHAEVAKIIETIFTHQKLYLNDLDEAFKCAVKTLNEISQRAKDCFSINGCSDVKLAPLEDLISYLLDVIFSIASFLEFYSPACNFLLRYKFESLITDNYNNTVPLLYSHIGELCIILFNGNLDSSQSKQLKKKLRILREEMIKIFHHVVAFLVNESIKCRFENDEDGVKQYVGSFLDVWHDCLAYDIFVRDYNQIFPVHKDILIIKEVNSLEVVNEKISFLMEAVNSYTLTEKKNAPLASSLKEDEIGLSTASALDESTEKAKENDCKSKPVSEVELQCLTSSVCDILPDVEVSVIRNYLLSMDYSVEKTVDAILKDSVAGVALTDKKAPESNNNPLDQRYNVFDGDEFDIMVHDQIDMSKVNLGKKKDKYKDVKELIDDKSHRKEMAEMYQRLGVVSGTDVSIGDVDTYDDEYDDTYDDSDVYSRRSFVVPRVLREVTVDSPESSENEDLEEPADEGVKIIDQFVANPAEIREKMEQRHLAGKPSQGGAFRGKDVTGKPKGQGQDHSTQLNRQRKATNKASRANHNRKSRATRKQQQGMF